MNRFTKCFLALFATVIIWGFAYPVLSVVTNTNMSAALINVIRFTFGALTILPFAFKNLKNVTRHEVVFSLFSGIILFLGFLFLNLGMVYETPADSALFVSMGVFVVPLLTWILLKKRPKLVVLFSVLLSFLGIFIINYVGGFTFSFNIGSLFTILSSLMFGLHIFISGTYLKDSNEITVTFLQLLVTAILSIIYFFIFEIQTFSILIIVTNLLPLAYLGILGSGVAYFFQIYSCKYLPVNICNITLNLETVFAILFSIILGSDSISLRFLIGSLLIFVGVFFVARSNTLISETK